MIKVFSLLQSFSKSEQHWFEKFLKSPVFNKNQEVEALYSKFKGFIKRKKPGDLSGKFLQKHYPELDSSSPHFHHVCNYLQDRAEVFLAWSSWNADPQAPQFSLLKAYRIRRDESGFNKALVRAEQLLEDSTLRNAEFYRKKYRLALENYEFKLGSGKMESTELQSISDWHDLGFIAEKLKNACILMSRQRLDPNSFETGLLNFIVRYVEQNPSLLEHPVIAVYNFGFKTIAEPESDEHFFSLKKVLNQSENLFEPNELRDIYLLAINFCVHRINLRHQQFLQEVFDLYKSGLAVGVFLEYGQLSRFTYTNIALAGLRLREFEWTKDFLNRYKDKLPETQRQGAYAFNLAKYHLEMGDYASSMTLLQEIDTDVVVLNLTAKAMLIRIYTETGASNALDSLLSSLKTYLRRKRQLSAQQRAAYQNLIRFMHKYQGLILGDKASRDKLKQEIAACELLAEKDWLLKLLEGHSR
ncbi:MAG: hypothetical protein R2792_19825 [Saprospiraceae bacterium]